MPHVTSQMKWVRPPRQTRSQETLERILDAAEAVFSEKSFEQATVSEIVQRANSSVGALYGRFNDKESLLACLYDRFTEEATATADVALDAGRWEGASVAEIFEEIIPFLVGIYQEKGGLIRAFIVRQTNDRDFAQKAGRLFQYVSTRLSRLLLERDEEISHTNPALAADFGLRMVFDVLDQATLYPNVERSAVPLSIEDLADELQRMVLGYLGVARAPSGGSV